MGSEQLLDPTTQIEQTQVCGPGEDSWWTSTFPPGPGGSEVVWRSFVPQKKGASYLTERERGDWPGWGRRPWSFTGPA